MILRLEIEKAYTLFSESELVAFEERIGNSVVAIPAASRKCLLPHRKQVLVGFKEFCARNSVLLRLGVSELTRLRRQ